jgi:hypothetical protein
LEAQQKEYDDAVKSIKDKGYPKEVVEKRDSGFRVYNLVVGDGSCVIEDDGSYDNERLECARSNYLRNRIVEMGIDPYNGNRGYAISELKTRLEGYY